MSLLDNVRQTLGNAASSALEAGQNLGAQAQTQIQIKRLQVEHAKKLHQLGVKTYEWHKSGNLVAAGPVPREIHDTCHALDDISRNLDEQNRKLEEARREAELRAAKTGDNSKTFDAPGATIINAALADDDGVITLPIPVPPDANRDTQILTNNLSNKEK